MFDITGGSFRVTIDIDADPDLEDPSLAGVTVRVRTENGESVTTIAAEGDGTETSIVNAGENSFFLDILAANANYEITVEDCTGDTGNDGGNGSDNGDTTNDDDGNDANDDNGNDANNDVIDDTIPDKDLPDTGGSAALVAGGAVFLLLYGALVAWRLKTRER